MWVFFLDISLIILITAGEPKNLHFIPVILKFTRNYVVIYDKGSLCTLGFKKCLLLKYITISIHQTVILHVHSIIRVIRWRGRGGNREVMCTYGGGGESREVTCACRGGRGVTCTCDFTPVSAKDTRSIVQREPSSETMPASPSVMSSVFLSAWRCASTALSSSVGYLVK